MYIIINDNAVIFLCKYLFQIFKNKNKIYIRFDLKLDLQFMICCDSI